MIEKRTKNRKRGRDVLTFLLAAVLVMAGVRPGVGIVFAETAAGTERLASDSNGEGKQENQMVTDGVKNATGSNAEVGLGVTAGTSSGASGAAEETSAVVEGEAGPGFEPQELVATESDAAVYVYEEDGVSVSVELPAGVELPEGAVLQVKPITKETEPERFALRCSQFQEKWSGDASAMRIYDIGFYTETGERVEVDQKAVVSFTFGDEPLEVDGGLSVIHFKTGGPEFAEIVDAVTDGEKKVTGITFRTNGFSDFGFMNSGIMPIAGGPGTSWYTLAGALFLLSAGLLYKYERGGKEGERLTDARE